MAAENAKLKMRLEATKRLRAAQERIAEALGLPLPSPVTGRFPDRDMRDIRELEASADWFGLLADHIAPVATEEPQKPEEPQTPPEPVPPTVSEFTHLTAELDEKHVIVDEEARKPIKAKTKITRPEG